MGAVAVMRMAEKQTESTLPPPSSNLPPPYTAQDLLQDPQSKTNLAPPPSYSPLNHPRLQH